MNPLSILKGSCTAVGAITLVAAIVIVGVHAIASLETPRIVR